MNIYLNLVAGIAAHYFDSESLFYFPLNLLYAWLWSAVVLVWLAWRGAKQFPVAGWVALSVIVEHSLISHKELRYIFPAVAVAVPLAAIGLARAWERDADLRCGLVLALLLSGPYMSPVFYMMLRWQGNAYSLYAQLAAHHPCEVAVVAWDRAFLPIAPVFGGVTRFTDATGAPFADAIVADAGNPQIPAGFTLGSCAAQNWIPFHARAPRICFWKRPKPFCQVDRAPPLELVYPPAARAFVIRDRLAP